MTQEIIDLTGLTAESEGKTFDVLSGVMCKGKIESYQNLGEMEDSRGNPVKMVAVSITVPIPADDVHKFMVMEDKDCFVQILVQPVAGKGKGKGALIQ